MYPGGVLIPPHPNPLPRRGEGICTIARSLCGHPLRSLRSAKGTVRHTSLVALSPLSFCERGVAEMLTKACKRVWE